MDDLSISLAAAVDARESGRLEESRETLLRLVGEHPESAEANLQCAWAHDRLGLESEAVGYYQQALRLGLEPDDARNAMLGLGSTLRALGRFQESAELLDKAVEEFPSDRPMRVFRALAHYNVGRAKEACEELLRQLVDTTGDEEIVRYQAALDLYASDLDRTWV